MLGGVSDEVDLEGGHDERRERDEREHGCDASRAGGVKEWHVTDRTMDPVDHEGHDDRDRVTVTTCAQK